MLTRLVTLLQHRPPKLSSRNRIIPPEEDMRRLMEECNVGSANAQFLMDLLKYAKPGDVKKKKTVIQVSGCRVWLGLLVMSLTRR